MEDDTIWSIDALLNFVGHEDADTRAWALERLARENTPRAIPAGVAALGDSDTAVLRAAFILADTLREPEGGDPFREPLRALARTASEGPVRGAAAVCLIRRGDEEGVTQLAAMLRAQSMPAPRQWEALATADPAACLALLRDTHALNAAEPVLSRVESFARVAPVEALHEVFPVAARMPEQEAWYVMEALLARACADHLFPRGDNIEQAFTALLTRCQTRWTPASPKARTWLAPTAFREVFQAARHNQMRKVFSECRAWDARVPAYGPEGEAAKALLAVLDGMRNPTLLHARVAIALSLAASERALGHEVPFERCAPGVQVTLACAGSLTAWPARQSAIVERYEDETARAAIAQALTAAFESDEETPRSRALVLAPRLPGYALPEAALRAHEDEADGISTTRVETLAAMPDALRALAPAALKQPDCSAVVEALGRQNRRWASALLLEHFDALLKTEDEEVLFMALRALGDVAALEPLVAAWRPEEQSLARDIVAIARLTDRLDTLPEALREEGRQKDEGAIVPRQATSKATLLDALDRVKDKPLVLGLRCNRCGRTWHQELGVATVHPNREVCKREGWDGICFERIAVCKFCGAEDDYTLPTFASMTLLSHTLASAFRKARGEDPVAVRVPTLSDGTRIHRPSDALRHWQAKIDKNPRDGEAWLRLAINLKNQKRYDASVDAFQRAISLRPGRVDAAAMFLDLLTELGRVKELGPYAEQVLVALPKDRHETSEFRVDAASTALKALKDSGDPHGLTVRWTPTSADDEGVGVVDLARITNQETLAGMLAHNRVTSIALKTPAEEDRDSPLERRVEAGNGFDRREGGYTIQSPVVRAEPRVGRNDPCPCGSGQKYKKCHGR